MYILFSGFEFIRLMYLNIGYKTLIAIKENVSGRERYLFWISLSSNLFKKL